MSIAGPVLRASPTQSGLLPEDAQALIAEARRRTRDRRRRAAWLILGASLAAAAVAAGTIGFPDRGGGAPAKIAGWPLAAPRRPKPSLLVAWAAGSRIEVLCSRTGRVVRTLATNVALYQGIPSVSVSPAGVVHFDAARGRAERIDRTPLNGGPVTRIAAGYMPAISPNGRLLAYVTYTSKIYLQNTPVRDMTQVPEAIVVRNLQTGTARRWAVTSDVPFIGGCVRWDGGHDNHRSDGALVKAELARLDATVDTGFADSVDKDRAEARDRQGIGGPTKRIQKEPTRLK